MVYTVILARYKRTFIIAEMNVRFIWNERSFSD